MAKLHRGRFSPVLSTYTALECWLHLSPFLHRHPYKLSYPVLIKNRERVLLEDTFIDIHWQEFSHVIAAIAKGELREIVCPEREEVGFFGNLVCRERCTRNLDHGTDLILHRIVIFSKNLLDRFFDDLFLRLKLVNDTGKWHHNLGKC